MGFRSEIKRTKVFNEFSPELQAKYFGLTRDKVIFNIDTLYYTVSLFETEKIQPMLDQLNIFKEQYNNGDKDISYYDMFYEPFHFCHYEHKLSIENMFDIFIASYLPNDQTPRVVVQLRSIGLWLKGAETLVNESMDNLKLFLEPFGIKIEFAKINRIDYAFHSNLIQSTHKFFNDSCLLDNLKTNMRIYQKVGNITNTVEIDYFCLGNRKSNNIFFRTYNKTREVVEKGYKGFFIDLWFKNGLISEYDKYCLEVGYKYGSYVSMNVARIDWYLEHGTNEVLKADLRRIREKCFENSDNYTYIKKALRNVLPEVTVIMNCEYQTKTKFFKSFATVIDSIPFETVEDVTAPLHNIIKIVRNSKLFTDYLTSNTVAFREKDSEDYLYWWLRIRQCKVDSMLKGKIYRDYGNNIDVERLKQRMLTSVAGISAYKNNINTQDLTSDIADFLCVLNDNDVCNVTIDTETGAQLEFKYKNYDTIKKRKQRQIKPLLEKVKGEENDD